MPRKTAPPKVTGGGGFSYASKVTAYLLTHLLTNAHPSHYYLGTIERLDLETKDTVGSILIRITHERHSRQPGTHF
jgi:hypothetical protein